MFRWNSPTAFKNIEPCTGGADDYMRILTEEIILIAEKEILGGGSPGILWPVCLPCMPSVGRTCFPRWQHVRFSLVSRHEGVHLFLKT